MSCAITSGYTLDCKDAVAGIKNIYISSLSNVSSIAQNASGMVTAITMVGSNKYYKFELNTKGANSVSEAIQADPANGTVAYASTISVQFGKVTQANSQLLQNVIKNRCSLIVEMKNGNYLLFGKEFGVEVSGGSLASGTAMNDFQGYTLEFTGMEKTFAPEVSASIISGIVA